MSSQEYVKGSDGQQHPVKICNRCSGKFYFQNDTNSPTGYIKKNLDGTTHVDTFQRKSAKHEAVQMMWLEKIGQIWVLCKCGAIKQEGEIVRHIEEGNRA